MPCEPGLSSNLSPRKKQQQQQPAAFLRQAASTAAAAAAAAAEEEAEAEAAAGLCSGRTHSTCARTCLRSRDGPQPRELYYDVLLIDGTAEKPTALLLVLFTRAWK